MNKKILIFIFFALIGAFCMLMIGPVKAYEETEFEGSECLTEDTWLNTSKTDYKLDQTTGKYVISGSTASEYKQAQTETQPKYVFYEVSADGKTLTAYVPNYNSVIKVDYIKNILDSSGIGTEADCADTLKVIKTISGNGPSEDSNNNDESGSLDNNTASDDTSNTVEKTLAPNTASPASIAAIVVGIAMVLVAAYVLLKKNNKLPFGKNN